VAEIPGAVRRLALHPFSELPPAPGWRIFDRPAFRLFLNREQNAQPVEPIELDAGGVAETVHEVRRLVREHGQVEQIAWLLAPEYSGLARAFEDAGLCNAKTPGFEPVENAFVLVEPPTGSVPGDVEVSVVSSLEEYRADFMVQAEAFFLPGELQDKFLSEIEDRYADHCAPGSRTVVLNASIAGEVVGTAVAGCGAAGINLFGAVALESARGRGVYRALTHKRWEIAVELGTPALAIQAGRMSAPIVKRLGFQKIGEILVYADEAGRPDGSHR